MFVDVCQQLFYSNLLSVVSHSAFQTCLTRQLVYTIMSCQELSMFFRLFLYFEYFQQFVNIFYRFDCIVLSNSLFFLYCLLYIRYRLLAFLFYNLQKFLWFVHPFIIGIVHYSCLRILL